MCKKISLNESTKAPICEGTVQKKNGKMRSWDDMNSVSQLYHHHAPSFYHCD